ncbi:MAG: glucose 1-dehydrogenase [Myxococcota bacterium]|nr:glucose 1-dehydrogenase [Myxococcales bacterium]
MALDLMRLDGRVAIVTGAGRGVGEGIALAMAAAGATVVAAARTKSEIDRTVAAIAARGGEALAVVADVTKGDELARLVDATVAAFGRLDVVVNNAGGQESYVPFLEIGEDVFYHHFAWNTGSAFRLSQLATPHLLATGNGAILNISSGVGHIGVRGMLPYGVAKAALDHLTRTLAEELAPKVRVNALALGAIMTPALQNTFDMDPSFRDGMIAKTPLKRIGTTEQIGAAAVFACSDAASYMTGAVIPIDGGLQDTNLPFKLPDL